MSVWPWYRNPAASKTNDSDSTPKTARQERSNTKAPTITTLQNCPLKEEDTKDQPEKALLCCHTFFPDLSFVLHSWSYAPKARHRLNDFLRWTKAGHPSNPELGESWEYITSYTDMSKADFCFSVSIDGQKPRHFLPLTSTKGVHTGFFEAGADAEEMRFDEKAFLGTGNTIKLMCPSCSCRLQISLLRKSNRKIDIQPIDIKNITTRNKVEEMKAVFPAWKYKDLRTILVKNGEGLMSAMSEAKRIENAKKLEEDRMAGWEVVGESDDEVEPILAADDEVEELESCI
jgi:hypothetical protein